MNALNLQAEIERLKAENQALKSAVKVSATIKVTAKGGVSVYGLGRFPVTLYKSQWLKLISMMPKIEEFIKANDAKLSTKE